MTTRRQTRRLTVGLAAASLFLALGLGQFLLERVADAQTKSAVMAPRFEVDPLWPKDRKSTRLNSSH